MLNLNVEEEFYDPCWFAYKASIERFDEYMANAEWTNQQMREYRDTHFP